MDKIFKSHFKVFPTLQITPLEFIKSTLNLDYEFIDDIPEETILKVINEYNKRIFTSDGISYYELLKNGDYKHFYSENLIYPIKFKIISYNSDYEYGIIKRNRNSDVKYLRFYELTSFSSQEDTKILKNNFRNTKIRIYENLTEKYIILTDKTIEHNSEKLVEYSKKYNINNWYTLFSKHNAFLIPLDTKLIYESGKNKLTNILDEFISIN